MEKNKFNLPFSLGNAAGYNGCNIYDVNSEYVCGLILPLHQTIQQIRKDAKTDLRTARNLELADYMINACNSLESLKSQKAALLAACRGWLKHTIQTFRELPIPEKEKELLCLTQSAIEQAEGSGE